MALVLASCGAKPPKVDAEGVALQPAYANSLEFLVKAGGEAALAAGRGGAPMRRLSVHSEGVDKFGGRSDRIGVTLSWSAADLAQVRWGSISAYQLADLAQLEIDGPWGERGMQIWCQRGGGGQVLTPTLCAETFPKARRAYHRRSSGQRG